jgi:hypothetical protein
MALKELFYLPNSWYMIRKTNNAIHLKFSHYGMRNISYHPPILVPLEPSEITIHLTSNNYTDAFDLLREIIWKLNHAIHTHMYKLKVDQRAYRRFYLYSETDSYNQHNTQKDYLMRTGAQWEREKPHWKLKKASEDKDPNKPKALKEDKYVWYVPPDWDPNLVDGRYVCATIVNERIQFQRKEYNFYGLDISFSNAVNGLLGFPHEIIKLENGRWNKPTAKNPPNMNLKTMNTIWIMCDAIENVALGDELEYPLLRSITPNFKNSCFNFTNPQFRRLTKQRIESIKIWVSEDVKGTILDIHSPLYLRVEFRKNVD